MTAPWQLPDFDAHEGVHFFAEPSSGLNAIIAIHSTHLGPAAGGVRFWHYAQGEAAITDALRLSRGMSYKNAMAGLPLGGGKGVIMAGAEAIKTAAVIDAFARAIDVLGGRYVTAQDVGISPEDMIAIGRTTRYVSGLPAAGAQAAGGDPGPFTADGVFLGVKAAVRRAFGKESVAGVHVAIQGVGSVGGGLARRLAAEGARLTLADLDGDRAAALAQELGAATVPADQVLSVAADVVSPCALGAILTGESIAALQAPVVAGGANNQLAAPADGERLRARGILYAPDYVINAGGIINVGLAYVGRGADEVRAKIAAIPDRLEQVWDEAEAEGLPSSVVADRMAQRLIGRG